MTAIQFMPLPFLDEDEIYDPHLKDVIMDMRFDDINTPSVMKDSSFYQHVISRAGDTILTAVQKKFGKSSCYFDGTGDYLFSDDIKLRSMPADFTIELWVYKTAHKGACILDTRTRTVNYEPFLNAMDNGTVQLVMRGDARFTTPVLELNRWHHLSFGRKNGAYSLYLNGIRAAGTYSDSTAYSEVSFTLGTYVDQRNSGAAWHYQGYTDHVRWWRGVSIRDGVNNFTPPSAPWKKTVAPNNSSLQFTALTTTFQLPPQFNRMEIELWGAGGGGSGIATSIPEINMIANRGGGASGGDVNYSGGYGGSGDIRSCSGGRGGSAGKGYGDYGVGASGASRWDGSGNDGNCSYARDGSQGGGYCQKSFTKAQLPTSLTLNVGQPSGGGGSGLIILTWS